MNKSNGLFYFFNKDRGELNLLLYRQFKNDNKYYIYSDDGKQVTQYLNMEYCEYVNTLKNFGGRFSSVNGWYFTNKEKIERCITYLSLLKK